MLDPRMDSKEKLTYITGFAVLTQASTHQDPTAVLRNTWMRGRRTALLCCEGGSMGSGPCYTTHALNPPSLTPGQAPQTPTCPSRRHSCKQQCENLQIRLETSPKVLGTILPCRVLSQSTCQPRRKAFKRHFRYYLL